MIRTQLSAALLAAFFNTAFAWAPLPFAASRIRKEASQLASTNLAMSGSLHGQNSCFLPLKQLDQDYFAPRIVQVRLLSIVLV